MIHAANIEKVDNDLLVSGDLNFQTVVSLWNKSLTLIADDSALHFNLSKVTSSNSAGVALMLEWIRYAKEFHRAIDFKNIPSQLQSIIAVSGIEHLVTTI